MVNINQRARHYAALGYELSAIALASPLDAAAPAVWRIVLERTARVDDSGVVADGVAATVAASTLEIRIADAPVPPEDLDAQFLGVAWELGAWDVSRIEHLPLSPDADAVMHGLMPHVADPYVISGLPPSPSVQIDINGWIAACKRHGWITWFCKPMYGAPEIRRAAWLGKDKTLRPDGSRPPRKWRAWEPVWIGTNHQTIIRLGKANHGNRTRTSS